MRALLLAVAAIVGLSSGAAGARPNFLFIYTDDQRWDALGVVQREHGERARFPWFRTPHLDRLANGGVRFRNAFVTLSLCAPSRATFLTSRYNHLNGVIDNETPFPESSVTHASVLRDAGYVTGYIGKWHMGNQRGARPGFTYSVSFVGQGKYEDCPFEINGASTATQGWVDDVSTDFALAFLREHRREAFSLVVGFKTPHVPLIPPPRAKERFAGEIMRPAPNYTAPAVYRPPPASSPGGPRPTKLDYFRCLSAIDDNVGRLLDALDELGLNDSTVVMFASDNGFYMGEHGLGDKRSAYDESLRIPLLLRYPPRFRPGTLVDAMALNLDLAPTLLHLAGVSVPQGMQGRSLVPVMEGRTEGWRTAFFYEYFPEKAYPQTPSVIAVRTDTAKLIRYPGREEWTELFDLKEDPYETRNLYRSTDHAELRGRLESILEQEQAATQYRALH